MKNYAVESYSVIGPRPEKGMCVKCGDDTVADFPFNCGWSDNQVRQHARIFAKALNAAFPVRRKK